MQFYIQNLPSIETTYSFVVWMKPLTKLKLLNNLNLSLSYMIGSIVALIVSKTAETLLSSDSPDIMLNIAMMPNKAYEYDPNRITYHEPR